MKTKNLDTLFAKGFLTSFSLGLILIAFAIGLGHIKHTQETQTPTPISK